MTTGAERLWLKQKHAGEPKEDTDEVEFSNLILTYDQPRRRRVSTYGRGSQMIETGRVTLSQIDFRLRGDPSVGKVAEILTAARAIGTNARLYFVYLSPEGDYISGIGPAELTGEWSGSDGRYWDITIRVEPAEG